jgi:hypothetical protein
MTDRTSTYGAPEGDAAREPRRQVPTLLIGLGGMGSRIVERIYARIPERERNRIATHVFDTDVSDLGKLQYAKTNDKRTPIGTDLLVGELRAFYPDVNAWLPDGGPQLDHKSTIRGAGQIRALGRLTLKHTLKSSGGATNLRAAMQRLNLLSAHSADVGVNLPPRVWVFCSLAGGTGAGTFMSVGLLARRLVQSMIAAPGGFLVNGVFVLPELMTQTNQEIPRENWESMRANAQAAIRELEAVNASLSGFCDPLQMESTELGGVEPVVVHPFDYAYLFDYANTRDQYLASEEAYVEQVARSMHLLLFEHMGDQATSAADNNIRAEIAMNYEARYVAPASSSLLFPRKDLVAYLSSRWGAAQIHDQWLAPDRAYEVEHARWKRDLRNHKLRPKPDRREVFTTQLRQWAEERTPVAMFFKEVVRQAHAAGADGSLGTPRGRAWVKAVEEEVKKRVEDRRPPELAIDSMLLRTEGGLRDQIESSERSLRSYRSAVLEFPDKHARSWAAACVTEDHDHDNVGKGSGSHRLNHWIFDGDHAVHPLAVRFVLYDALTALDAKLKEVQGRNESRRAELMAYESAWDDPTTPDVIEVIDRSIEAALRGGFLGLGRRRAIDRLAEDYEARSGDQYGLITKYMEEKTLEAVLVEIRQEVATFTEAWESFFLGLETVRERMEEEQERARLRLDASEGSSVRRVLASEAARDALWKRLVERASDEEPADVASATYRMLYARHCSRNKEPASSVYEAFQAEMAHTLAGLIRRMAVLPDGVAGALRMQADLVRARPEAFATEQLELVKDLASPWVQTRRTPEERMTNLHYWGLHPAEIGGLDQGVRDYLGIDRSAVDHGYDRDEIIFFKVPYLLRAADLFMFTPAAEADNVPMVDGTYFKAFRSHQRKVLAGQITAHLDHRWDRSLPDFWDEGALVRQLLMQGLAIDVFEVKDGRWQATVDDPEKGKDTIDLGDATGIGRLRALMDGIADSGRSEEIRRQVKARMADEVAVGQREHKALQYHAFIRRLRQLGTGESLFLLVGDSYFRSAGENSAARERQTQAMFLELCETIRRYTESTIGDAKEAARGTWLVVKKGIEEIEDVLGKRRSPKYPKSLLSNLRGIANEYRA